MNVLILAAGTGSRLWPLTRNTPKSLLELGRGMTLLETQLEAIRPSGVRDIVIVTGYRSSQIEAKIQYYDDFNFQVVYNPWYEACDNMVSAWLAKPYMQEDFVMVNGDDIYHKEVFERLLAADGEVVMVASKKPEYDEDDAKVYISGDRVYRVSKEMNVQDANGESIGMIKFTDKGRNWWFDELDRLVRTPENLNANYLFPLQVLMDAGLPVHYVTCSPDEWAEIDFHPDLALMKRRLNETLDALSIE